MVKVIYRTLERTNAVYGQVSLNKGGKVGIEDNLIKEAYKVRVTGVVMI